MGHEQKSAKTFDSYLTVNNILYLRVMDPPQYLLELYLRSHLVQAESINWYGIKSLIKNLF